MNSRYKRLRCFSLLHKCADLACDATDRSLTRSAASAGRVSTAPPPATAVTQASEKYAMPAGDEAGPEARRGAALGSALGGLLDIVITSRGKRGHTWAASEKSSRGESGERA